jgi:hypothetical protein
MLDLHITYGNGYRIQPSGKTLDPVVPLKLSEAQCDGFVKSGSRNFDSVGDAFNIGDRHPARFHLHDSKGNSFAFCSPRLFATFRGTARIESATYTSKTSLNYPGAEPLSRKAESESIDAHC